MVCFRKCVCESGTHTCVCTLLYMCMNFKVSRVFEVKESGFEFGAKLPRYVILNAVICINC